MLAINLIPGAINDLIATVLEVEFPNGSVYQYWGVPSWIYAGLMAAASKGSYLYRRVRGVYSYQKVY